MGGTGAGDSAPGNRSPLDRDRLVAAALELLDEVGLDDLSMRRLAERLGVTAASLYWYVRDKNDLLALLADAISAEMPLPNPSYSWREALEASARSFVQVMRAHRDAARVLASTAPTGPHRLRAVDALLGLLRRAGFPPADVADIGYVLNAYIVGFMLDQALQTASPAISTSSGEVPPLDMPARGHLIVERGAVNLTLRADASLPALYELAYTGRPPEVSAQDGTVRIRQRHERHSSCTLALAGTVPWHIDIEGGASRFVADLRDLSLTSFQIAGGVSQATVQLPQPSGTVPVGIDGGANNVRIQRPPAAAIRLRLHRESSHISLDGVHLGAAGGGTDWESPDFGATSDRYSLEISGGVNELSISAAAVEPAASQDASGPETPMPSWLATEPPGEYPNLTALSGYLAQLDLDRSFEIGLQIVLDGLERRLDRSIRRSDSADSPGSG